MFEKLYADADLTKEIVFFMHHCLVSDCKEVNSSMTLPCVQVICKHLLRSSQADWGQCVDFTVLQRALVALEIVTRKNSGMLSQIFSDFYLHKSLVCFAKRSLSDAEPCVTEIAQLSFKLICRLIHRRKDVEFHCTQLLSHGILDAIKGHIEKPATI